MVQRLSLGQKIRPWIPAILGVCAIAWESTGVFTSENTGHWLYRIVTAVFGAVDVGRFEIVHAVLRKFGHFIGYGILSYFFFRGWRGKFLLELKASGAELLRRPWKVTWAINSVIMTLLVAALDEFHQSFLAVRTGTPRDVVLDTLGGIFVQVVIAVRSPQEQQAEVPEEEKVS